MDDHHFMARAIELAEQAALVGEVPVGAVVVLDHQIVGEGFNQPIRTHDPSGHAEIIALRQAGEKLGNYRLNNTTLYVTLEPCAMCAGAIIHARVKQVVFGAKDPKTGAAGSCFSILGTKQLNHVVEVVSGVSSNGCSQLLKDFFRARR